MNLIFRRFVYIFFIIIFLLAAPVTVLYTMGYRYNFSVGRVQKTGLMKITSVPKNADIFLNGIKYEKSKTPAKIEYLLPGDYEIKISKEGYHDWQKKLAVYENGTTFAEKIILWKNNQPEKIEATTTAWSTSPDGNKIALGQNNIIKILNINSGLLGEIEGGDIIQSTELPKGSKINKILFSSNSKKILIDSTLSNKKQYWIYSLDFQKLLQLPTNFSGFKFNQKDNELYGYNNSGIFLISSKGVATKQILRANDLKDFLFDFDLIYLVNGKTLDIFDIKKNNRSNIEEFSCTTCRLEKIISSKLFVFDDTNKKMNIIDLTRKKKTLSFEAKNIDVLSDNLIMFYNDWEIFIYDFNKESPELITRIGEPILAACWHPKGKHLFFSTKNKIKVIELDNRELRNIIDVSEGKNYSALRFDRAGNILYSNSDNGVEKLKLK